MQKLQILFPDPLMERMREVAQACDLPVSEVVRRATETWLHRFPEQASTGKDEVPVFRGGEIKATADEIRELVHE